MLRARKRMLAPAMAAAVAASLAACSDESAGPETGADVEDVADEPIVDGAAPSFVGQTVTVSAQIEEIVSPEAFRIGEDEELLVLSEGGSFAEMGFDISEGLVEDDVVLQVTGTVREFDLAGFEEELGVDYDDALFEPYEGEQVIVADEVSTLAGEQITIAGEVEQLISTVAFRLAGVGWNVVVLDAEAAQVAEGDFVQVDGTVRQFEITTFEEEFGVDLDDALYEPFEGELVLVAENVTSATPAPAP